MKREELIKQYRDKFLIAYTGESIEKLLENLIDEIASHPEQEAETKNDVKNLLADIIAWELDLSQYPSLESILQATYSIQKKSGINSPTKEEIDNLLKLVSPKEQEAVGVPSDIKKILNNFKKYFNNQDYGSIEGWIVDDFIREELAQYPPINKPAYPEEFIEWIGENCQKYTGSNEWYYIKEVTPELIQQDFNDLDELFTYWETHVKDK
jgi:hypothetical protein